MMKRILFASILAAMVAGVNATPRNKQAMKSSARTAINNLRIANSRPIIFEDPKILQEKEGVTIYGFEGEGFAVISNDDKMPEILGVSDSRFSGTANTNFQWWLKAINEVCQSAAKSPAYASGNVPTPASLGFEPNVDPIVTAEWSQEEPYNMFCPKDKNNHLCLTGCVATAIAQVLYTHKTPVLGSGTRTNFKSYSSYQNPSGSYEDITFTYDDYVPDYDLMIDCYTSGPNAYQYTDEQAEAMATLMLACGVAVNMGYGSDGSGAYTDQAAEGLIQYMGITTADFKERDYYTDAEWMTMVYEELEGGHCMYYSAVDPSPWTGGGHAFVCDGYDEQGRVHINWGWAGKDNGYYNINLLDPSPYEFSKYQDFIRGLWDPNDSGTKIEYIKLELEDVEAGTLKDRIGVDNFIALRNITISGELNNDDLALLKRLATADELTDFELDGKGHLTNIDLTNAVLAENTLGDNAFQDCKGLTSIKLPRNLEQIGSYAFAGCSRLSSITSYTYNVPKTGNRCFEGVSSTNMRVSVIAGSSEYYKRNAQWKTIIAPDKITEFGSCLKAKNATREQGAANPVFGFTVTGDRVVGAPRLYTDATVDSAPGKYTIFIEPGTIEDLTNVVFVPGTLTVKPGAIDGIDEVEADDAENNSIHSINGIRLKDTNNNGLYIVNGKKVVY